MRKLAFAPLLGAWLVACPGSPGSQDDPSDGGGGDGAPGADGTVGVPPPDGGGPDAAPPQPGAYRIIGYFAAWGVYGRDYHVPEIPAAKLTHVNYAFLNISADGDCVLGDPYADVDKFYPGDSWDAGAVRGSFHQLQLLKAAQPHLRVLLSVGGWSWSGRFSDVALTAASRARFAASCVDLMEQYGFDGVDIDWEYPGGGGLPGNVSRPEDPANFTLLLEALRAELDARGSGYLLTIAAPAAPALIDPLELEAIHPVLDWINVMTYDFHGGWDSVTGFNSPLYAAPGDPTPALNTDAAVQAYLDGGVPAHKVVVGVPFYGRGWSGVPATSSGLFQPSTGLPPGTWEAGVFDYHDLAANYVTPATRHFSDEAKVPWLYDPATGVFISYDDAESLGAKTAYIRDHDLGGAMFWELSGDDPASTLLSTLAEGLLP